MSQENEYVWQAFCGVCDAGYETKDKAKENPHPYGVFCPQCRDRKLIAPGVLNFEKKSDEI